MKKRLYAKEIKSSDSGKDVLLQGWVQEIRDIGKLKFIVLRDVSGIIQITAHKETTSPSVFSQMSKIPKESVIAVEGKVKKSKQAPGGREVLPTKLEIISEAAQPLPIDVTMRSKTELPRRLDWRSLDLRRQRDAAIFKIQAKLVEGMQEWLNKNDFLQVFTPCIMGAASESGAEVFQVMYFGKPAFLRQDPQLHRQLCIAAGLEKIYDLGPSWRAELSHTTRHLCEHRGCAVEFAFLKDEVDTIRVEEQLVVAALKKIKKECKEELGLLNVDLKIPKIPFPVLQFPEIYDILKKLGKSLSKNEDLDTEAQNLLADYVKKKYKADFYFINRFPFSIKPFYVMKLNGGPWARSVDLYCKGIEMSSGGQREHRYKNLIENVKEKGMNLKSVEWFTKFFKYGVPLHGGFNIGIERLTQAVLGLENIREAALFPRDPERLLP